MSTVRSPRRPRAQAAGPQAYRADANKAAGPVVRYRLNSLLDRASDNGAPPYILGMAPVIAGEVKTSPADFTEPQIRKDLSLAAKIGADIYVMVAVYPLTPEQEGMATTLAAAEGCQLLTFSGRTARP